MEKEFVELIQSHIGVIYKVCNIYFYKSPNLEDYRQEILIRLWKAFPGFKNKSKFSTWMYRVALNAAIDIVRKICSEPRYSEISESEFKIGIIAENILSNEQELLYMAISTLDINDKALILLYLEDYSYNEISEMAGITIGNVGVKINRIKKVLIEKINGDDSN